MKTNCFSKLIIAVLGWAAFSTAGHAGSEQIASAVSPPAMAVVMITAADARPGPVVRLQFVAATSSEVAAARWSEIKDCTYDLRAQFFAGLSRLEARVEVEIRELAAKRAAMTNRATDTREWDFAMKEMENAQANLKSSREEMSKATRETWAQAKDKVSQAWVRTQAAFANVKSSTTS